MSDLEYCIECDQPTGRAGRDEDSLFPGGEGPYCESCYEEWPEQKVIRVASLLQQLTTAQAENEALRARVAELEGRICRTCDGHGMIGGPSYAQPDEGGEPCPECSGFLLRKQAEAVQDSVDYCEQVQYGKCPKAVEVKTLLNYAQRLRTQADELERQQ